jgi:alcohol oxidase
VSYGGSFTNVAENFLDVAAKYDKKRSVGTDANNLYTCNVYAVRLGNASMMYDVDN